MSVVPQKEKKVEAAFKVLGDNHDEKLFIEKFKELYPKDWQRIVSIYNKHERKDTKGKGHPIPEPEKYLSNTYKVYVKNSHKEI